MTTFFTSDEHYGHRNIIGYCARPFADVDAMREELIRLFNERVTDGDVVWHLGDFSLDEREVARVLPRLKGTHHLIAGNHDACHPRRSQAAAAARRYLRAGFASVQTEATVDGFHLCHLPYEGEPRYPEWRPRDEGKILLHGHVHGMWLTRDRMINVGVDVWGFAPVALDELRSLV
jgi:calcineurin-like phosphoesterase family protein